MIRVEELFYRYDQEAPDVLLGVSLTLAEGSHTALIGPNGCGKTTLIKHLNALLFPTAGSVSVDGMKTIDTASVREIRRCVGMVFQNPESPMISFLPIRSTRTWPLARATSPFPPRRSGGVWMIASKWSE